MARQDDMLKIVKGLRTNVPELAGVLIASTDGLAIAHDLSESEATRTAAMAATALGLGKRITQAANLGDPEETVVRGNDGYMIIYSAGQQAVMAIIAPTGANVGLIHLEARGAAQKVSRLLAA